MNLLQRLLHPDHEDISADVDRMQKAAVSARERNREVVELADRQMAALRDGQRAAPAWEDLIGGRASRQEGQG